MHKYYVVYNQNGEMDGEVHEVKIIAYDQGDYIVGIINGYICELNLGDIFTTDGSVDYPVDIEELSKVAKYEGIVF